MSRLEIRKKQKNRIFKISLISAIVCFSWAGIQTVTGTIAYFNDAESFSTNATAGTLDFYLESPSDFFPAALIPGESVNRTINFLNSGSMAPRYRIKATHFSGELCGYLSIKVELDGVDVGYDGPLLNFEYGPVVFEGSEIWIFTLALPVDAPESVRNQNCNFDFSFFGSQAETNLEFGYGFNDIEEKTSNIASNFCDSAEMRSKGYWKNHPSVYLEYLPQYLGDELIDTEEKVKAVLGTDYDLSMHNKLKGQLLAMKFNAALLNADGYFVNMADKTIGEIIADADNLLRQDPEPSQEILELMKNLLEGLTDLDIKVCSPEILLRAGSELDSEMAIIEGLFLSASPALDSADEFKEKEVGEEEIINGENLPAEEESPAANDPPIIEEPLITEELMVIEEPLMMEDLPVVEEPLVADEQPIIDDPPIIL